MRDIVSKRRLLRPASSHTVPAISMPIQPASPLARGVETGLSALSNTFDWFKTKFDPESKPRVILPSYKIREESLQEHTDEKKTHAHRILKTVQSNSKIAAGKVRDSAQKNTRHIKTPLGKLAVAHTLALLTLFAYVAHTHPTGSVFQAKNIAQTVQGAPLRNYLPNPTSLPSPQPFSEQLADIPKTTLPLNTWVTPWTVDEIGQHYRDYASLSAFWLTVQPDGFTMSPKADWSTWTKFRATHSIDGQKYFLTVTGNPEYVTKAISDPTITDKHIASLLAATVQYNFDGIDLDYEGLGIENRDAFTAFTRKVAGAFHARNKLVSVCLEARIANQVPMDWENVSTIADQVRIMAYDYHSKVTPYPGPITPIGWLQEIMRYAVSTINPNKLSIALGNYGYDWVKADKNTDPWNGTGISYDYAKALSDKFKTPILRASLIDDRGYDTGSIPTFSYKDEEGKQHSVWFEDNQSLQAKIDLVKQYKVGGGIFFWSIGFGDKTFWDKQATNK